MTLIRSRSSSASHEVGTPPHTPAHGARVRVMKFVSVFESGGTEPQFVTLGLALNQNRFALEYGCLRRLGPEAIELRGTALREYGTRPLGRLQTLWQQLRLARHLSQRHVHIVQSYNFYANVFAIPAAWLAGTPVTIAAIRDRGLDLTPMQRRLQRAVCRLADCVLVNAESTKEWLIEDGFDASRIVVIRNGIETARFNVERSPSLRTELGVPAEAPVVAVMSRLHPMKGIEDFIDAAAIVSWCRPDVRFLIVGGAPHSEHGTESTAHAYRKTLEDRITRLGMTGRIVMTGHRSDIPQILAETAVSVLPSLSEGLSNVLLESMAAGVPVVATRVGGAPEAVDNGLTGFLVPPGDPQALATFVGQLLDDPGSARQMGAAARESVERFAMDRMVRATERLYLDLLARKAEQPDWRRRIGLAPPVFADLADKRS